MINPNSGFKRVWRYFAFVGIVLGALYPIAIAPMIDPTPYQNIQKLTRKNIKQEDIQPGNMKVWSDPFGRK